MATAYADLLASLPAPEPGVGDWLGLMGDWRVPCALVTSLDRATAAALLERMGLRHNFDALVTGESCGGGGRGGEGGGATCRRRGVANPLHTRMPTPCTRTCARPPARPRSPAPPTPPRPPPPPHAADDDMETIAQRYLVASMRLGRPPNQVCVRACVRAA